MPRKRPVPFTEIVERPARLGYKRPLGAAVYADVDISTIWRLIREGALKAKKLSPRVTLIAIEDLDALIEHRAARPLPSNLAVAGQIAAATRAANAANRARRAAEPQAKPDVAIKLPTSAEPKVIKPAPVKRARRGGRMNHPDDLAANFATLRVDVKGT